MTALLVKPLSFTVVSATADALYPATNANYDENGLAWRYTGTIATIILDLGANLPEYDTIALVGCNIDGGNTVTITGGNSTSGTGAYSTADIQFPLTATPGFGAKCIHYDPDLLSSKPRYVKIVINAPTTGDSYLQFNRIIIGKSVNAQGIDIDPEQSFLDQSVITEGPGYYMVDPYPVLPIWKASVSWQSDSSWRTAWVPFFVSVGMGQGFLFVPNLEAGMEAMQTEACFGRMIAAPQGKHPSHDLWTAEINMQAIQA